VCINNRIIRLLLILLFAVSSQACVRNTMISSWIDQSFKGPVNGKILVVGIFKDSTTHKIFEDSFVESLVKAGAEAVPSYPYGQGEIRHSKKWLDQAVQQSGASFVLITHLSDERKQVYTADPHGLILGGATYENSIVGYQSYVLELTLEQGYTLTKTEDYIAATLFDCLSDKPIWSSKSKSVNLDRYLRAEDEQMDNLLIKDMKHHHLL